MNYGRVPAIRNDEPKYNEIVKVGLDSLLCSQAVIIVTFYEPRLYTAFYKLLLERQELESLLPDITMGTTRGTSR